MCSGVPGFSIAQFLYGFLPVLHGQLMTYLRRTARRQSAHAFGINTKGARPLGTRMRMFVDFG